MIKWDCNICDKKNRMTKDGNTACLFYTYYDKKPEKCKYKYKDFNPIKRIKELKENE